MPSQLGVLASLRRGDRGVTIQKLPETQLFLRLAVVSLPKKLKVAFNSLRKELTVLKRKEKLRTGLAGVNPGGTVSLCDVQTNHRKEVSPRPDPGLPCTP